MLGSAQNLCANISELSRYRFVIENRPAAYTRQDCQLGDTKLFHSQARLTPNSWETLDRHTRLSSKRVDQMRGYQTCVYQLQHNAHRDGICTNMLIIATNN